MTRSRGFARISLRTARWLLPWIVVLFVSTNLAYALSSAVYGGGVPSNHQPDVQAAANDVIDPSYSRTTFSVRHVVDRRYDESAVQGATFGVMSITSPSSTGHASPDGCCTWD